MTSVFSRYLVCLMCVVFGLALPAFAQTEDSGEPPTPQDLPYHFPFFYSEMIFDPGRPFAYFIDPRERKIYFANLETGLTERQFPVEHIPVQLFQTLDGSKLYILLITKSYSDNLNQNGPRTGVIVEFDLERQVKLREIPLDMDPFDIVVSSDGYLYVSSFLARPHFINSYNLADSILNDSTLVDQFETSFRRSLALHPDEKRLYSTPTLSLGISAGMFTDFRVRPEDETYVASYGVEISPKGDVLVSGSGVVVTTSENQEEDLRFVGTLTEEANSVTFDTTNAVIFSSLFSNVRYHHLGQYVDIGRQPTVGRAEGIGVYGDTIYVAVQFSQELTLIDPYPHPFLGGKENAFPEANFTVSADSGNTETVFVFDASTSNDAETPLGELQVRWDWESDGTFDTRLTTDKIADYTFPTQGTKTVTLEVRDALSAPSTFTKELQVGFAPEPGSPPDSANVPYEIAFGVSDALFEPNGEYLYLASNETQKLHILNLKTGLIEKEFAFDHKPESITITPSGKLIYITLLPSNNSSTDDSDGQVAIFDSASQSKINQFSISTNPTDIVATDDGYVYVTGRSFGLNGYRVMNREFIYSRSVPFSGTRIKLHPSGEKIYAATVHSSPSDIMRFYITEGSAGNAHISTHVNPDPQGDIFIMPSGDLMVTRDGNVLTSTNERNTDMRFHASLKEEVFLIEDVFFDEGRELMYVVSKDSVSHFRYHDFTQVHSSPLQNNGLNVGASKHKLYVLTGEDSMCYVEQFDLLNIDSVSNESPTDIPLEHTLFPNYPNPFNQSTTLRFGLSHPSQVRITIFNSIGQEVATLLDTHLQAGYHEYYWHTPLSGSGIYFAQMTTEDGFSKIVKLMVVK